MIEPSQRQVPAILVIRSGAIGDTIVMSVVFQALRRQFPCALIEAAGIPDRLRLINTPGLIDRMISFELPEMDSLFSDDMRLSPHAVTYFQKFDVILLYSFRLAKTLPNLRRFDPFPPDDADQHITTYLLKTLHSLGIPEFKGLQPTIALPETSRSEFPPSSRRIAIHPGSGSRKKNWAVENFIKVMKCLHREDSCEFLIIAGPAEKEVIQEINQQLTDIPHTILRNYPLPDIAAELQRCPLFIGNDSGMSHLAAAVGMPTIAIFGPSNPHIWRPVGSQVIVLYDDTKKSCEAISVEQVFAEAAAIIRCQSTE